jgi:cold shock CspA family protein
MAENQVRIGKVKMVDPDKKFGIILEQDEHVLTTSYTSGSVYFQVEDEEVDLKEGQIVQFVKQQSSAGPQAKHIVVIQDSGA